MVKVNKSWLGFLLTVSFLLLLAAHPVTASYKAHNTDADAGLFLQTYPSAVGTKLDNCYLCHTGGYNTSNKYLDSCDYCHFKYGFKPPHGNIAATLNTYGTAYLNAGRDAAAFAAIDALDSDGDGFSNGQEILAGRLPGDSNDNPNVVQAPAVVYTSEKIRQLAKTTQFMAVDTAKSGDYFGTYAGVDVWRLLQDAGVRDDATDITVFAADGYSRNFLISDLKKSYTQGKFYNKYPWIGFSSQAGYTNGQQLAGDLHYLLAYERDGFPLMETKIVAGSDGKSSLDGEGPYRFVTPLSEPVTPDRSQWTIDRDDPPYPFNPNRPAIRNGDYCIKVAVAFRVNTATNKSYQYDFSGRVWEMVEKGEFVVYGAINPQ
ncbi:MAG: hypothetical protein A4E52_00530 [Pelotomaculum sp. PtaB.Bin013]|nr:MAG: hypothetical protein A4E52_00530 [Pelotomaculum sp. PtaB.Bin013]